ncbi:MAG: glutamine amidotransferase [Clostridia bacterium]|nr:glutamine amidotransferase [Clostridia bacterium]
MELNILHLYPDLLNLYGDKGNLAALEKRASWRGISVNVTECTRDNPKLDLTDTDIVFLGGGPDKAEEMVCGFLKEHYATFLSFIENNGVLLATCGGFSMLGKEFPVADGFAEGLGLLDITTTATESRFIGNVMLESNLTGQPIVGFENHTGKTLIGKYQSLGAVVNGYGNTGDGDGEGLIYKNVIATHLHGPLLPKNPELCDEILDRALKKKYPDFAGLAPLDDTIENLANAHIVNAYGKK